MRILALLEASTLTGPARNLIEFAREVAPGLSLEVVLFARGTTPSAAAAPSELRSALADAGLTTHTLVERYRRDPGVVRQLRALARERDAQVVQSHAVKSHTVVRLSALWRGRTWVAFHHGYTVQDLKMRLWNQFDRWSLRRAHHIVTVSDACRRDLVRRGVAPSSITVIHNAIDARRCSYGEPDVTRVRQLAALVPGEQLILSVGRLSREKGQRWLLEALAIVAHRSPELSWRAVFLGTGPDRADLEQRAAYRGISKRVVFIDHSQVIGAWYACSDVLVLPSLSEGSPNVLLEAAVAQIPMIAARVGGVPEMLEDGVSALLVPPANAVELAAAVERVLRDRALGRRLAAAATDRVGSSFSVAHRSESLTALYRSLVGSDPAARSALPLRAS